MDFVPVRVWVVVAAPFAGSLLGVLARRLPAGRPVMLARSACDTCHAVLGVRELVPLVSYVVQLGRCRRCGAPIGLYHPAMELACMGVAAWAASVFDGAMLVASCVLGWMLLALAVCDAETGLLPDALSLPLLVFGLLATVLLCPSATTDHAVAAACGYGAFRGIAWLYRRLRGWDGLGGGDAKLLAASGAWLGVLALPWLVLIAALLGLLYAFGLMSLGRIISRRSAVAFGPFLALATWLLFLYG